MNVTVIPRVHDTTGCQTGCATGMYRVNKHPTGCQTGCQTGLTTVLNEQPLFVQRVVKPDCTTGLITGCIHDTTGCIV